MTDRPNPAADQPGFALDLSREGAALFRRVDGGWHEVERLPLQLGAVGTSMAALRAAAGQGRAALPVEVWLPDSQVIIKAIETGGVAPVPAMIQHAFADAAPDGLAGIVLEGPPRATGPLYIATGVPRSVLDEAIAFVEPHGFAVQVLTTPEPPAGLDHAPVFRPDSAQPSGMTRPRALMAAAAAAAVLLGGAFTAGVITRDAPEPSLLVTDQIRQVSVAPDFSPALAQDVASYQAPAATRAGPDAPLVTRRTDPPFTPPTRPVHPGPAQSSMAALSPPTAPLAHALSASPGADRAPRGGTGPGGLTLETATLPSALGAPVQTHVAALAAPANPGTAPDVATPGIAATRSSALPEMQGAQAVASALPDLSGVLSRPEGAAPDTPTLALALAAPLPDMAPTALPGALARMAAPPVPAIAPAPRNTTGDNALPPQPSARLLIVAARPDIVPPLRPRRAAATPEKPDTEGDVTVIAALPDIIPPERPGTDPASPETADDTATATDAEAPSETDAENTAVIVTNTRPDIVPPLRPTPDPPADLDSQNAGLGTLTGTEDAPELDAGPVRVVAARPDIVPPLRPRAAAEEDDTPDVIAALIDEAGDADLSPSSSALTRRAPPPRRPAAIVTAERERIAAAAREEEERLAALQPSENALRLSSAPRKRPARLAGPQVASLAAPSTESTPTPAPAPATTARRSAPPLPTAASVARAATIENALPLRQLALIGVYGKSGNRHALLRLTNGRFVKVEPGDSVAGFSVSAISADAIRLRRGGRDTLLVIPD